MKNKGFGKYLRECREPIMSLQDFADILDCSKPYLWDIEKGNIKPPQNYKRLADIANRYGSSSIQYLNSKAIVAKIGGNYGERN